MFLLWTSVTSPCSAALSATASSLMCFCCKCNL
jgi:hypothetical protein